MSPTKQWLIIVFGGTTIMVITMVCGVAVGFSMFRYIDGPFSSIIDLFLYVFSGGAIGAVVGVSLWVWLGYMVCRDKKPAELPPGSSTS